MAERPAARARVPEPPRPARPAVRAVVLAAGAAHRFGGDKLLAVLDGKPILQYVLDGLAEAGLDDPVVVVPPGHARLRAALTWRRATLVVNPRPDEGLSSSLHVGWQVATRAVPAPDAVLLALGDQPRISPGVVRVVLDADLDPARPVVAPRYLGGGGHNPLRIEASASELVAEASGDRGLGPVIAGHPNRVRWIDVPGTNPDVDRRSDLEALAGH